MTDQPKIYGYCRASREEQTQSPKIQAERIAKRAATIEGAVFVQCYTDEGTSGSKVPYNKRPEFSKLLHKLESGDHLIVWRVDRIDRNPFRLVRAMDDLVNRGVIIHSLEEKGGMALDLDTVQGRIMLFLWAIVTDLFVAQLSESIKAGIQWRKLNGLPYHPNVAYGRRRIKLPKKKSQKKAQRIDVWDEKECRQIREIKRRHDAGESMPKIAADFRVRNELTAMGKQWARPYGKQKRLSCIRFYNVYKWYNELLAEGNDLGAAGSTEAQIPLLSDAQAKPEHVPLYPKHDS